MITIAPSMKSTVENTIGNAKSKIAARDSGLLENASTRIKNPVTRV
jgi:hypothetical protein